MSIGRPFQLGRHSGSRHGSNSHRWIKRTLHKRRRLDERRARERDEHDQLAIRRQFWGYL